MMLQKHVMYVPSLVLPSQGSEKPSSKQQWKNVAFVKDNTSLNVQGSRPTWSEVYHNIIGHHTRDDCIVYKTQIKKRKRKKTKVILTFCAFRQVSKLNLSPIHFPVPIIYSMRSIFYCIAFKKRALPVRIEILWLIHEHQHFCMWCVEDQECQSAFHFLFLFRWRSWNRQKNTVCE